MHVTTTMDPSDALSRLLYHHAERRVLICVECRYAIQPKACSGHLKDLHQMHAIDRRNLIRYIEGLELADPADVVLPQPHDPPIPFLPVESGYACGAIGCKHLCITKKRMKNHWHATHFDSSIGPNWRSVNLQTFFRGNQLRYFVVSTRFERQSNLNTLKINSDESFLMRHFQMQTYQELGGTSESRHAWQVIIPRLATKYDFLKHGILAYSALHCAYLHPSERQNFRVAAAYHQDKGLPEYRQALSRVDGDNCNATLAFSQLLIMHCFASQQQDEDLFLFNWSDGCSVPDWLHVLRASCTIFGHVWDVIQKGPLMPLIIDGSIGTHGETSSVQLEKPDYAVQLDKLIGLPNSGKSRPSHQEPSPYPAALMKLYWAFESAQTALSISKFSVWTAVCLWPAQVSDNFLHALRGRDPPALILLAHYCVMLQPLESHWCMKGFRKRLLSRIYRQLEPEWRCWLEWPIGEIGLGQSA